MNKTNLIPARRQRAQRARCKIQLWTSVGIAQALLMTGVTAAVFVSSGAAMPAKADVRRKEQELAHQVAMVHTRQASLNALRQAVSSRSQLGDQPDWSLLLAAIARAIGDDGRCSGCGIEPVKAVVEPVKKAEPTATPPAPRPVTGYTVNLDGIATDQNAVSRIVLRLEDLRIFDRVELVQTSAARTPSSSGTRMSFQITCSISAGTKEVEP